METNRSGDFGVPTDWLCLLTMYKTSGISKGSSSPFTFE